ncbi:MAG: hypothetical protein JWM28_2741 [Chitinophagaceae bacterium]|nr:hypothetical protein [Chitinophagaceae bacterium]
MKLQIKENLAEKKACCRNESPAPCRSPQKIAQKPNDPGKDLAKAKKKIKDINYELTLFRNCYNEQKQKSESLLLQNKILRTILESDQQILKSTILSYDIMKSEADRYKKMYAELSEKKSSEKIVQRPVFSKVEKPIKLICINTDFITGLNDESSRATWSEESLKLSLYETYTSPGKCLDVDGNECYWINETNGPKRAERFKEYK